MKGTPVISSTTWHTGILGQESVLEFRGTYSRETEVCNKWVSNCIDHDISLSRFISGVETRESVDMYPFQVPVHDGRDHSVQDMNACTDAPNL